MAYKKYLLPELNFPLNGLEPIISEEQLALHYQKHHQSYVNNTNAILEKIDKARKEGAEQDFKSIDKEFSFNLGGHILHSLFWGNLCPVGRCGVPEGKLNDLIISTFGSLERLNLEFSKSAVSAEGSGWAVLHHDPGTNQLIISQIEKHNVNVFPQLPILMVLDVWEHAYYLDYKNDRAKYVENFWQIVNWKEVGKRLS